MVNFVMYLVHLLDLKNMEIQIELIEGKDIPKEDIKAFYNSIHPSKSLLLNSFYDGIMNSDIVVSAWDDDELIGLGNAISDGDELVYFPHILVAEEYEDLEIKGKIKQLLEKKFKHFMEKKYLDDKDAFNLYKKFKYSEEKL